MKKILCFILALVILVSCSLAFASEMSDKYDKALELFMQKQYKEAAAILDEISVYNDASQLSLYCKSLAEGSEGNYAVAYNMLDALGEYKDAKIWSVYFKACEAQDNGDVLLAYDLFYSIPLFQDVSERLGKVQTGQNSDFKKEYELWCTSVGDGLIVIKKDNKYGYADIHGNIVLDLEWDYAESFVDGLAIVEREFGIACLIDTSGNIIGSYYDDLERDGKFFITTEYDFSTSKRTHGIIDNQGNEILEAKYEKAEALSSSCFAAQIDGKYALFNRQGVRVSKPLYEEIYPLSDHLVRVKIGDKYGVIDSDGIVLKGLNYDGIKYSSSDLYVVKANEKCGYIDSKGNQVIDLKFDEAYSFMNDVARVKVGDKWGYIDPSGNTVIPFEYESLSDFKDGIAYAKKNGKYGYIDEEGNTLLDFKWDYAGAFSEGKAFVIDESGAYFINLNGDKMFEVSLPNVHCEPFKNGISFFTVDTGEKNERGVIIYKYGMLNNAGEILIDPVYDRVFFMNDNLIILLQGGFLDGKYGVADLKGNILFDAKYDLISSFSDDGYALVRGEMTWFIIDAEGNVVF